MSLLRQLCVIFLTIITLLIVGLGYLLGTQSGLNLLFNNLPRVVPGLTIQHFSGTWRDLHFSGVKYHLPGITVAADQLGLGIDFSCFKQSQLCVNQLTSQNLQVLIDTKQMPDSKPVGPPIREVKTPYPILLRQLLAKQVHVNVDGYDIQLARLQTAAKWQGRLISVLPSQIEQGQVQLAKWPAVTQQQQKKVKTVYHSVNESLAKTLNELFSKPIITTLPTFTLPLDLQVDQLKLAQIKVINPNQPSTDPFYQIDVSQLLFTGQFQQSQLLIKQADLHSSLANITLRGKGTFAKDYPLDWHVNAEHFSLLPKQQLKANLTGALRQKFHVDAQLTGPLQAQINGNTQLAKANTPLDFTLTSKQLHWPLTGKPQWQLQDSRIRLTGSSYRYQLSARSGLKGTDLPDSQWFLDGHGSVTQFVLTRLRTQALQGVAELNGVVDWQKALSWRSHLRVDNVNTAKQWPKLPIQINGALDNSGSLYGGNWQVRLPKIQFSGRIKQYPWQINGQVTGNQAMQWKVPQLLVQLADNQLQMQGEIGKKINLDANIDAPRLNGILPELAGNAKGYLQLRGSLQAPQLNSDLTANALQVGSLKIANLRLVGQVTAAKQVQGQLNLQLSQLQQGSLEVKQLELAAQGNEQQHQVKLSLAGKPVNAHLLLQGRFERAKQQWQGRLSDTQLDTPIGNWHLTQPASLSYLARQQQLTVGAHCWQNQQTTLCADKPMQIGKNGNVSIHLLNFDLSSLNALLGVNRQLQGGVSGNANVSWQAGKSLPSLQLALTGQNAKFKQAIQGGWLPLDFSLLTVNSQFTANTARLQWQAKLVDNGGLQGDIQVSDPMGRRQLSGTIGIDALSLSLFKPLLTQGEKSAGTINSQLRLAGDARRPQLFGQLLVDNANVDGSFMPFDLTHGRIALNFLGMRSTLEGKLQTAHGDLLLNGQADWQQLDAWRANIHVQGEKVRVSFPPMVRLAISPQISLNATPNLLTIDGKVDIPWARITVHQLPDSVVNVSADEVMLDNKLQPVSSVKSAMMIQSNLLVHIGDNVKIDAFGLKAKLEGDLKVAQDHQALGLHGQVNIPTGRFHAYGQDLLIRRGQLLFSGSPEQPLLNIETIRNPDLTADGVIAGVRVTGVADEPQLEVFSEPTKSQQEALSYLLRGQGLDSSGTDSGTMTSLLISMGLAKSGKVVGKLGEVFGVQGLALDTEGVGDKSQVMVSGYILPNLQVKYGIGIFDSLATLTLRYQLMPKLYLEAISGVDQALDVLYQFEF